MDCKKSVTFSERVNAFSRRWSHDVSCATSQPTKPQTIYFSRRRRQVKSHLTLNGRITTLVSRVQHIGVTFDTDYMGNSHGNHLYQGLQNIY